jgi:hypothetical protein
LLSIIAKEFRARVMLAPLVDTRGDTNC